MRPLLSIVIANYNYSRFLEKAILSILSQKGDGEIELIIVDGGSTDNSVEVIKKYAEKISWWCSEPDGGQSAAFNKGFLHSTGKYLTWLNADDVLISGCLAEVVKAMKRYPACEWFTGNFIRFRENDKKICEVGYGPHVYPDFLQRRSSPIVVFGPTTFFSRDLCFRLGGCNVDYHYTMDTDLWERFIVAGVKQKRIRCLCWGFRMHESSKTAEFGTHVVADKVRIAIQDEKEKRKRNGYRASSFLRVICLLFRILDGSLFHRAWLKFSMIGKHVQSLNVDV